MQHREDSNINNYYVKIQVLKAAALQGRLYH